VAFPLLVCALEDVVGLVVIGELGPTMLFSILERPLIEVLTRLEHCLPVLLALPETALVVLAVLLLQPALPVIVVISDPSHVDRPVGLSDPASGILLHIVKEGALIDIPVLVPEDSLPVLLPAPELPLVAVLVLVGNLPLAVEEPPSEGPAILEDLLPMLQLSKGTAAVILTVPELSTVTGAILLEEISSAIELVIPEVAVVAAAISELQVALARPAALLHRPLIR
jgi:hypothetical protein